MHAFKPPTPTSPFTPDFAIHPRVIQLFTHSTICLSSIHPLVSSAFVRLSSNSRAPIFHPFSNRNRWLFLCGCRDLRDIRINSLPPLRIYLSAQKREITKKVGNYSHLSEIDHLIADLGDSIRSNHFARDLMTKFF